MRAFSSRILFISSSERAGAVLGSCCRVFSFKSRSRSSCSFFASSSICFCNFCLSSWSLFWISFSMSSLMFCELLPSFIVFNSLSSRSFSCFSLFASSCRRLASILRSSSILCFSSRAASSSCLNFSASANFSAVSGFVFEAVPASYWRIFRSSSSSSSIMRISELHPSFLISEDADAEVIGRRRFSSSSFNRASFSSSSRCFFSFF
mmetsp:Transcript_28649/g.92402  ORF Transcript_28649/g.92402 Transcript_28649/m.92402 type:complete len:207 (+) Transcript_28649:3753-4373(+)